MNSTVIAEQKQTTTRNFLVDRPGTNAFHVVFCAGAGSSPKF